MKLLVFNAHNDDAIIGAGGTITKLLKKGWQVAYVYFTDSRGGTDKFSAKKNIRLRAAEAAAERKFLGIKKFWEFGFVNGKFSKISSKQRKILVEKIRMAVKDFNPDLILLPSVSEGHPEHRMAHDITMEALRNFGNPILKFLLWAWPDIYKKQHDSCERVLLVDISKEFKKKISAVRRHKSQVTRRHYDEIAKSFNIYLAKIFKTKFSKAEVFGVVNFNKNKKFLQDSLKEFVDVTKNYEKWN